MRKVTCLFGAVVLALSLSVAALGGDMQGPGFTEPPPPPSTVVSGETPASANDSWGERLLLEFLAAIF